MIAVERHHPPDLALLASIHDAARRDEIRGSLPSEAWRGLTECEDRDELHSLQIFLARSDGQPAGFIGITGNQVGWLYVHPDHYRQGIGRRLLQQAFVVMARQGHSRASVITLEGNARALRFYRACGFQQTGDGRGHVEGLPCCWIRLERPLANLP